MTCMDCTCDPARLPGRPMLPDWIKGQNVRVVHANLVLGYDIRKPIHTVYSNLPSCKELLDI